jgi:hypothetical protein
MRRSKAARLPAEVREELERLWREGRVTLDQMMEFVRSKGVDVQSDPEHGVSRSGLHRYLKSFGEAAERMRQAQQIAGSIVGKLSETGSGDVRRLLTQLLSQVAMYQLRAMESEGVEVKPAELMFLAKAIRDIEGAFKTGVDAELKVRKEIAAELQKRAAPALDKIDEAARSGGLSPETAAQIRKAIAEVEV